LVPHFEPEFFDTREFQIEFDGKLRVTLTGADLLNFRRHDALPKKKGTNSGFASSSKSSKSSKQGSSSQGTNTGL